MVDEQGRVYPEKWLGRNWRKVLIEQLNESFNPKRFLEAAAKANRPPANICYTEFTDADNSNIIPHCKRIKRLWSFRNDVVKTHVRKEVRDDGRISWKKAPGYVYVILASRYFVRKRKADVPLLGRSYMRHRISVLLVGNMEDEMRRYSRLHYKGKYYEELYGIRGIDIRLQLTRKAIRERTAALLRKVIVHEFGHLMMLGLLRTGEEAHAYTGEAIAPSSLSEELLRRLKVIDPKTGKVYRKRFNDIGFFVGNRDSYKRVTMTRSKHGISFVLGDVMSRLMRPEVTKVLGGGWEKTYAPAHKSPIYDRIVEYDYQEVVYGYGKAVGYLCNVYFSPRNIRHIRRAKDPY